MPECALISISTTRRFDLTHETDAGREPPKYEEICEIDKIYVHRTWG